MHSPFASRLAAGAAGAILLLAGWPAGAALPTINSNSVRMAAVARLEINARPEVGALRDLEVLGTAGSAQPPAGAPESIRALACEATFPIIHFAWTEFVLRFTPASNGLVQLTLSGPREESAPGVLIREEVLWDAVEMTGATLTNGGFEELEGNRPLGWICAGGVANAGPMPPLEGRNYARTSFSKTLAVRIPVRGGQPTTLRLMARSIPPLNYADLRRPLRVPTPGHGAARNFLRGVNLGNGLEATPGQGWAVEYTLEDLAHIKAEGFDHVRIPVAWQLYTGPAPKYEIATNIFERADYLVTNALDRGLNVILNVHHFDEFNKDPEREKFRLWAIWRQLGTHYAMQATNLTFEILNEPTEKATTTIMNAIYERALDEIRVDNPERTVFIGPGSYNSVEELKNLRLPFEDDNIIVSVHCYEPGFFTHQGASWVGGDAKFLQGIVFPGPPAKPVATSIMDKLSPGVRAWITNYQNRPTELNPSSELAFRAKLRLAKQWGEFYGRPVHVGEFGAYMKSDPDSRARYYAAMRRVMGELGLGWAMWDWKAGFPYWDSAQNQPAPGLREALFPKK